MLALNMLAWFKQTAEILLCFKFPDPSSILETLLVASFVFFLQDDFRFGGELALLRRCFLDCC